MAKAANDLAAIGPLRTLLRPDKSDPPSSHPVLAVAAWHSLAWLFLANLAGVWLAILLLYPHAGRWMGEWTYGRWTPVHLNFRFYGWIALPLVAWVMRIYRAHREPVAVWARAAFALWSVALTVSAISWLSGSASGKLFLDWTGYPRIFFPLVILFVWVILAVACVQAWRGPGSRPLVARLIRLTGLAILLTVPAAIYIASGPAVHPAVNPDTGGLSGAIQFDAALSLVFILLLLPWGLASRRPARRGPVILIASWLILAVEASLSLALGSRNLSPLATQVMSLAAVLVWVPLLPAYFDAFKWPRLTRIWRMAALAWWILFLPSGWICSLPGVSGRLGFTDGLVGLSFLAMAGFGTSLLILILTTLLGRDGEMLNSRWPFIAWHGATLASVVLSLFMGWFEGVHPAFTMVPGPARNILYALRLLMGLAMTAASAEWLLQLTRRLRSQLRSAQQPSVPRPFEALLSRSWQATETESTGLRSDVQPPRTTGSLYALAGGLASVLAIALHLHHAPPAVAACAAAFFIVPWAGLLIPSLHFGRSMQIQILAVIAVAGLAFAITLIARPPIHPFASLIPPTPVQHGRAVYIAEGCASCHSQFVRPHTADVTMWGPVTDFNRIRTQQPPLIGYRRLGPDLSQVGARRSPLWMRMHFMDPRDLSYNSPMPRFDYLFRNTRGEDLITYLGTLNTAGHWSEAAAWQPAPAAWQSAAGFDGGRLFAEHCATCHTAQGHARLKWSASFQRLPPDLGRDPFRDIPAHLPAEQLRTRIARIAKFGVEHTDMPGHEYLPDAQIAAIADYVANTRAAH